MFGNFIYFILVLLIYLTYTPAEQTHFSAAESLLLAGLLSLAFAAATRHGFKRIELGMGRIGSGSAAARFQSAQLRGSVLAVAVFALDVYGLNLPSFLIDAPLFSRAPTLQALLFLALFTGHLCLVWAFGFEVYRRLHPFAGGNRRHYVGSHVSFSLPVLIPWALTSALADAVNALPFESPRAFLSTTEGQFAYFGLIMLAIALVGPLMIQKLWRCTPLAAGGHRERIEALCRRAGMDYRDILSWPLFGGRMVTAAVMGLIRRFRYILVTPALLDLLEPFEVDAVVAHEIGHIKRRHLVFYLVFFAGYLLVAYVAFDLILYLMLFVEPVWWLVHHSGVNEATAASTILSLMMIGVFLVYFRFVFGYFMRNFERQADTYVYRLFDSARPLVTTLQKIAFTSGEPRNQPNWHHFGIGERIDYLQRCERDPDWIRRHDVKVRRSIAVYLAGLVLLGTVGYQLNLGTMGARMNNHLFAKVIVRQLERQPANPALHGLLGDFKYARKQYAEARSAWESALALKPDTPAVLNNLAWLLATCEEPGLRDPVRALELAERAAGLEQSAYILDTLAESYHVNGRHADAVAAARLALRLATGDPAHYERQLAKFLAAAGE
ncbi:MAG: M48 family metalloprotease [Desulfobacterales bacterium]|jgi:Zn-dependent protease with chaperone function|nr:M48 family metalloprotease [Desulfobacterales bacterium]